MPLVSHTVEVGASRRRMAVAAPEVAPTAVIVSLHGTTSDAGGQARTSAMAALAGRGAVVAFPEGSVRARTGWQWDLEGDVEFLDAAVEHLRRAFDAPAVPLVACGMSGGARMASRFATAGRSPVAVLGAVAGLRAPSGGPARPTTVVAFHGTGDRINPYPGGRTDRWQESVPDAAAAWARANGWSGEPETTEVGASLTRLTWGPAGGPGSVTLWTCAGAGHTWPGTHPSRWERLVLGRVCTEVDATAEIWKAAAAR